MRGIVGFFGFNKAAEQLNKIQYILVSTNTTTSASKALIKYDLDGNEVASKTYAEVGGNAAWRPRVIYSELDDDDFYYSCGDATGAYITKWNKDLTISLQSSTITNSPEILVVGKNLPIFIATTQGYALRSKTDFTSSGSVSALTDDKKIWYRISDIGVTPPTITWVSTDTGQRVLTTNSGLTAYETIWNNAGYDADLFLYNKSTGEAMTSDGIQGFYFADVLSSTRVTKTNFDATLRFGRLFSNGDAIYYNNGTIIRRTWSNLVNNLTTNVWTISVSNVVWMDIDEDDNLYVATSGASNNLRKYNSSGSLVWQLTLSPNPYGGGLTHK